MFNSLVPESELDRLVGGVNAIDGTVIFQVGNPADIEDVNTTINNAITVLKAAGKKVVNVQFSLAIDSTNDRVYAGVISYSNNTGSSTTTSPMIQFTTVALQNAYTSPFIVAASIGLVSYGQTFLTPSQYSVTGTTITINPGFDVEAGLLLTIQFK